MSIFINHNIERRQTFDIRQSQKTIDSFSFVSMLPFQYYHRDSRSAKLMLLIPVVCIE